MGQKKRLRSVGSVLDVLVVRVVRDVKNHEQIKKFIRTIRTSPPQRTIEQLEHLEHLDPAFAPIQFAPENFEMIPFLGMDDLELPVGFFEKNLVADF